MNTESIPDALPGYSRIALRNEGIYRHGNKIHPHKEESCIIRAHASNVEHGLGLLLQSAAGLEKVQRRVMGASKALARLLDEEQLSRLGQAKLKRRLLNSGYGTSNPERHRKKRNRK